MVPSTAVLDLDKLTFKPPWTDLTYSIHSANETEISFSVDNDMISSSGTLNRVTGRLDYSTTLHPNNSPLPSRCSRAMWRRQTRNSRNRRDSSANASVDSLTPANGIRGVR
jgi:hypothetical protein